MLGTTSANRIPNWFKDKRKMAVIGSPPKMMPEGASKAPVRSDLPSAFCLQTLDISPWTFDLGL
jgi:hypothetical protein